MGESQQRALGTGVGFHLISVTLGMERGSETPRFPEGPKFLQIG